MWSTSDSLLQSRSAKNTVGVTAGAFGFEAGMEGSPTIGSSTQTVIGSNLSLVYAVPAFDPPQTKKDTPDRYPYFLHTLGLKMYFLEPLTKDAFWIPEGVKGEYTQSLPWCISWHANSYQNVQTGWTQTTSGQLLAAGAEEVSRGLRTALLAKLQAFKAAYDRGDTKTALNVLQALMNQVKAQAGKGIPQAIADRWIYMYERLQPFLW